MWAHGVRPQALHSGHGSAEETTAAIYLGGDSRHKGRA